MLRGVVDKGKLGRGWMKMGKGRETRWRKRDKQGGIRIGGGGGKDRFMGGREVEVRMIERGDRGRSEDGE